MKLALFLFFISCANSSKILNKYPDHWWSKVDGQNVPVWEMLPSEGTKNKTVILSKRHELGLLSNFAPTPFMLDKKTYASIEGLWQSTKYPDPKLKNDPRHKCKQFKLTRAKVEKLVSFEAKSAGDAGSQCMRDLAINWVSYNGQKMIYREASRGIYFALIYRAMKEKWQQNIEVQNVLAKTKGLSLLPDHKTNEDDPPAWKYFEIWQEIRDMN